MKTIKILGTGCAKCKQTEALVNEFIQAEHIDAEVIKVEDIQEIMKYNVLMTPVLVVDEQIKVKGKVPSKEELKNALA